MIDPRLHKWQLLIACLFFLQLPSYARDLSRLNVPAGDGAQDYYAQLLHLALVNGAHGRALPELVATPYMEQQRMIVELRRGNLVDVTWAAASTVWEKDLRIIPIPLDRGLLGYRQFIIRKDMVEKFDKIKNLVDLRAYVACQGNGWPDVFIMRKAGLEVREVVGFEPLYKLVSRRRCDYLPRGYLEATEEMLKRSEIYPDLMVYTSLILYYPNAMYFYVNRNNEELAQWLENGLNHIIDNGEFATHLQQHLLKKVEFPFKAKSLPRFIEIDNASLPLGTNIKDSRYWFQRTDFHEIKK